MEKKKTHKRHSKYLRNGRFFRTKQDVSQFSLVLVSIRMYRMWVFTAEVHRLWKGIITKYTREKQPA